MTPMLRFVLVSLASACIALAAYAVGTSHWTHTSEADFKAGTLKDVVATNLGDLKLSRAVKTMLGQDARISAVHAMAQLPDGTVLAATGPEGVLLQIKDDQITTAAELGNNLSLCSILTDPTGRVLVGTAGEKGQIYRIDRPGARPQVIFEADGVQYIWAMHQTAEGDLYAATGPNGQLFEIKPDGSSRVLFDSDENNLLCLIGDEQDSLFAGSDPSGLVYRIDRRTGDVFVLYDAQETEISALARDAKGNLYAATAQATEPGIEAAEELPETAGRPESQTPGVPIPSERPPAPEPPKLPDPSPGDPLPIPREGEVKPKSMMILQPDDDEDGPPGTAPVRPQRHLAAAARLTQQPVGVLGGEPGPLGNAIYRIDPEGFVTEIFRQSVMVYCLIENEGTLLAGTGTAGEIYQIDPAAEETSVLAKVDPKDVLCMLPARDGRLLLGLANSGDIAAMSSGFAGEGTYTSPVLDASQISRFGKIRLRGTLPAGTSLKLSTRSGNVAGTSDAGWSAWSEEISALEFVHVSSPPARFLQYRLRFSSNGSKQSPTVEEVDIAYQVPNLAPQISSITVTPGDVSAQTGEASPDSQKYSISWEGSDPNEDVLVYSLHFRSGSRAPWILLKDKLRTTSHEWETRSVADGTYQIRVEASDATSNPLGTGKTTSRVSDPVLVDNTAPAIGDLKNTVEGSGVTIEMKVVDRTGTVASAAWAVDSSTDWQAVLPLDRIADSPEESYRFTVPDLSPGEHQIMVRALDKRGNAAFATVNVTIEKR